MTILEKENEKKINLSYNIAYVFILFRKYKKYNAYLHHYVA